MKPHNGTGLLRTNASADGNAARATKTRTASRMTYRLASSSAYNRVSIAEPSLPRGAIWPALATPRCLERDEAISRLAFLGCALGLGVVAFPTSSRHGIATIADGCDTRYYCADDGALRREPSIFDEAMLVMYGQDSDDHDKGAGRRAGYTRIHTTLMNLRSIWSVTSRVNKATGSPYLPGIATAS